MPGWRSTLKYPAFDVLTQRLFKMSNFLTVILLSEYSTNIIGKSSSPRLSLFKILGNMAHMQCRLRLYHDTTNHTEILIELSHQYSFGTNYVLNDHEDLDQYDLYAIPSHIMTCYIYPASLVN